jgi:DNA-directed RNA polymerase subunit RPC12/RpoP
MAERFVVSTECPTCAAPLDFGEGTNALRCAHCRSNLLVTGRKQVLSYTIATRMSPPQAVQIARFAEPAAGPPFRVADAKLCYLPYYRLTGSDFRWVREPVRREPEAAIPFRQLGEDGSAGVDFTSLSVAFGAEREEARFEEHAIEKNFIACHVEGVGPYSLGVRPSVLRLELFRTRDLEARATVVPPDVGLDAAMEIGLKSAGVHRVLYREVVARVLSIIYFPFWIVAIERSHERSLTIVDGVAEKVVSREAPAVLLERLRNQPHTDPPTLGFRPLVCPNCGWDLPVRPDDVVFFCSSCERAWRLEGERLWETRFVVVTADESPVRHLPFWVLDAELPSGSRRFFLPGFRFRRLKILSDLAGHLARKQPVYTLSSEKIPELYGGYFDPDDASALARFIAAGLDAPDVRALEAFRPESVRAGEPTLTWIPFRVMPHSLIEPATGMALPANLLF